MSHWCLPVGRGRGRQRRSIQYLDTQHDAVLPEPVILINRFIRRTGGPEGAPHGNWQQQGASSDLCLLANTCAPTGCVQNRDLFCFASTLFCNGFADYSQLWCWSQSSVGCRMSDSTAKDFFWKQQFKSWSGWNFVLFFFPAENALLSH